MQAEEGKEELQLYMFLLEQIPPLVVVVGDDNYDTGLL